MNDSAPGATVTAREKILTALKAALPESSPLPDLPTSGPWQTFDDPFARFCEVLESVGGVCRRVADAAEADLQLRAMEQFQAATVRLSTVDGIGDSTVDQQSIEDPHELENVDFAVVCGHFGVAENAAIWVTDDTLKHRVLYFIAQHVAIVIPAGQIVNNMHEAYGRIAVGRNAFATFISGPSKTADIEQSLVIGAHGARSLTVFAVDDL